MSNTNRHITPPQLPLRLFRWFCRPEMVEDIEGDLLERFNRNVEETSLNNAKWKFIWQVILLFRSGIVKNKFTLFNNNNQNHMLSQNLKISWRILKKNKGFAWINIGGLAIGMTVSMLIGFWVLDELSFNKSFKNYPYLGQLYQNRTFDGKTGTYNIVPQPMSKSLKENYPDFAATSLAITQSQILTFEESVIRGKGMYVEAPFPEMFSMEIIRGKPDPLGGVNEIMLSESMAFALIGNIDPIGKVIRMDNQSDLEVTAVYRDFPGNTSFNEVDYLTPWSYYQSVNELVRNTQDNWGTNDYQCYVQIDPHTDWTLLQAKVRDIFYGKISENENSSNPELILQPIQRWHLYANFTDGVNTGGAIELVWLFGIIGIFILILACINFMNLSTAQSAKRSKEIGIRKTIGSLRSQLVNQFLCESFLVTIMAFILAIGAVALALSRFNELTGKTITLPVQNPHFWLISLVFITFTSLLAGSYPSFYLSSIKTISNLKNNLKKNLAYALPRKVLVVLQFTISMILIIGTMIIYRQIQFIKNRPIGYDNQGLIYIAKNTPELQSLDHDVLRNELFSTGVLENVSESSRPVTSGGALQTDFDWEGKDPGSNVLINTNYVTHEFGKTIGFQMIEGRDFSREYNQDQEAVILNETAAKLLKKNDLLGSVIERRNGISYQIIGIIKDIIHESPYQTILPAMYFLNYTDRNFINIKIKPTANSSHAIREIEKVFLKLNPSSPFDFTFVDKEFAQKFADEEKIGKLSMLFAVFALFISALGLFGLASFIAERRTKEIGVRKILGASVLNIWSMLSKEFVILVMISTVIAIPFAWIFMNNWLREFTYHTVIHWWIFAVAGLCVVAITLLTVSIHTVKAAIVNPIKSLRNE